MATPRASRPLSPRGRRPGEGGQALVEFAIVAPLVVLVLLFSIWFYELLFVKLKAQEAARYAAWEATAYPLHDYAKGGSELGSLSISMRASVTADATTRYAMDQLPEGQTFLAASYALPAVAVSDGDEEKVPGGWMPNLLVSVAGNLFDWLSALDYQNPNPVALTLIGAGEAEMGHALESRMFGDPDWGFNTQGYVEAEVRILVENSFFRRGVGRFFVEQSSGSLMISERHGVLADSWGLEDGGDVYGGVWSPGATRTAFGAQVERMMLMNSAARGALKPFVTGLWALGNFALGAVQSPASINLTVDDFVRPVVVSRSYGDPTIRGQVEISQDRPGAAAYDTAPATNSAGSPALQEYGKTLEKRGPYFMGCQRDMSLGCPSSTLPQDSPFGSYIVRE